MKRKSRGYGGTAGMVNGCEAEAEETRADYKLTG